MDIDTQFPNSWNTAREFAAIFGYIPQAFAMCIRTLRLNHLKNREAAKSGLDETSDQLVRRLLNSKTLKAAIYYALLTYYEEVINTQKQLTKKDLITPFGPGALASVLGLIYLNRYSKKVLTEGWEALSRRVQESSEIGGLLGQSTPRLGFDMSLLVGPVRHLASVPVLKKYPRAYIDYKRHLKKEDIPYDSTWEMRHWGCSLGQIGSVILQTVGFGIPFANAFFQAMSVDFDMPLDEEASAFRILAVWSEAMLLGCGIPKVYGEDEYVMEDYQMEKLLTRAEMIRENGSKYAWLNKSKEDITIDKAPALYSRAEVEAHAVKGEEPKDELDELFSE